MLDTYLIGTLSNSVMAYALHDLLAGLKFHVSKLWHHFYGIYIVNHPSYKNMLDSD